MGFASAGAAASETFGPVGNDTLWTVAGKVNQPRKLGTTAQVAWALFRANPQAFDGAPGKIHKNATLAVPDAADVKSVSNAEAYAKLTGTTAPAAVAGPMPAGAPSRAAPAAQAAKAPAAAVRSADPHALPLVQGVQPGAIHGGRQAVVFIGSGFRSGARLDLFDLLAGTTLKGLTPARIADGRVEALVPVGRYPSNWLVVVRNADGTQSEEFGFAAGPGAVATGVPEPASEPSPAAAAEADARAAADQAEADRIKAEQRRAAQVPATAAPAIDPDAARKAAAKAAAEKAALDAEFERQFAAERAAYETKEAAKRR